MVPRFVEKIARVRDRLEFFCDSGAFTVWTKGTTITLDEYCGFLRSLPFEPDRYLVLDVIGDPEGSRRNFDLMVERGFHPTPIVTRGDDPAVLDYYYQHADLVGLGGVTAANRASVAWCGAMMEHVGDRQAHILGMTRLEWIKKLRPWSTDSSSWLQAARYGMVNVYMGHGKMFRVQPRSMTERPPQRVAERIRRYGIDPYELIKPHAQTGAKSIMQRVNTMSWIEYAIEQREAIGTRLFLAVATEYWFEALVDAYDHVLEIRSRD